MNDEVIGQAAGAFRQFSETGVVPVHAEHASDSDFFELLFLARFAFNAVAAHWFRLGKGHKDSAGLMRAKAEGFMREALMHSFAFQTTVRELYELRRLGHLTDDGLAFGLERQGEFLVAMSREMAGDLADFLDGLLPRKPGPKAKAKNELVKPGSQGSWPRFEDQRAFMLWAVKAFMELGDNRVAAMKQVLDIMDQHQEIRVDRPSLERWLRRQLGGK